ncbi:helix-turn-helix transcriptional regulator [Gracilibacillus sp. YIM 98692]|uniref:helix-turn-helix domain-containing protein n=1 Tax=Gracilibacillus sp. YIM 98692 TaxID=2663532 RepID=UPI0013D7E6CF|nr:helix-turn-helix transcriptional regulator [Gracilibacillus sp. YIM 98692]
MAQKRTIEGIILGSCIREIREQLKEKDSQWTQEFVAKQIGMDEKHYGKLERGYYPKPQFQTIAKLMDILDASIDEFWRNYKEELKRQNISYDCPKEK